MAQPRAGRAQVGGELGLVRNVSGKGCASEARAARTKFPAHGQPRDTAPPPRRRPGTGRQAGRKVGR